MRSEIPNQEQLPDIRRAFADRVFQTWCDAIHLDPELVNLSAEESEALKNYLYANWLIVQCKNAAVRISPQTWEGIEARMLLVQEPS